MPIEKQRVLGSSEVWHQVLVQVSQVAPLNRPVLIVGERGTGKELIAERLHYLSSRWQQSYLQVNCAAMQENLLESELFGHETGAFTGAVKSRAGLFERADSGSLFLDELATASLAVQEKLLRVIEYGRFERLGGSKSLQVDVRIIAACNEDLPTLVDLGRFRGDLLDRLAFDVINLPPLRYRSEDIPELAEHFALKMSLELGYAYFPGFTEKALTALIGYRWPGNVRELKNVVERSLYRHATPDAPIDVIVFDPFASPWRNQPPISSEPIVNFEHIDSSKDLKTLVAAFECDLIAQTLATQGYQQTKTAEKLGISYDQLRAAIKKYPTLQAQIKQQRSS